MKRVIIPEYIGCDAVDHGTLTRANQILANKHGRFVGMVVVWDDKWAIRLIENIDKKVGAFTTRETLIKRAETQGYTFFVE